MSIKIAIYIVLIILKRLVMLVTIKNNIYTLSEVIQ